MRLTVSHAGEIVSLKEEVVRSSRLDRRDPYLTDSVNAGYLLTCCGGLRFHNCSWDVAKAGEERAFPP